MAKPNLILIRAAIRARTGQELSLERVRDLLFEEGLISLSQAKDPDLIFRGYGEYFETDEAYAWVEPLDEIITKDRSYESDQS